MTEDDKPNPHGYTANQKYAALAVIDEELRALEVTLSSASRVLEGVSPRVYTLAVAQILGRVMERLGKVDGYVLSWQEQNPIGDHHVHGICGWKGPPPTTPEQFNFIGMCMFKLAAYGGGGADRIQIEMLDPIYREMMRGSDG